MNFRFGGLNTRWMVVPFMKMGHIGGSGWSCGGVGNPEFFYDHVNFEMCTKHQSEDIWYAVGFMNMEVKR